MDNQAADDIEHYAGRCTWCGEDVVTHGRDPSGDVIEWEVYTGERHTFCTLYHVVQWFNDEYDEAVRITVDD